MQQCNVKIGLKNGQEGGNFEILIPPVSKTMRFRKEIFCIVSYQGRCNIYPPSFVKIPNGGLSGLVELTWSDPYIVFNSAVSKS